jgi:hypothetical protein
LIGAPSGKTRGENHHDKERIESLKRHKFCDLLPILYYLLLVFNLDYNKKDIKSTKYRDFELTRFADNFLRGGVGSCARWCVIALASGRSGSRSLPKTVIISPRSTLGPPDAGDIRRFPPSSGAGL